MALDTPNNVQKVSIEGQMKTAYLEYALSVISSRALPDARDGLKPVHRRILFAAHEGGYHGSKPYSKSARIVGDVMGKYHPHGDSAIYESMVRMAQPFAMRECLIDGQGNFGSIDGDPAAAMRYTEARMSSAAHHMLADIDRGTIDWAPTYDNKSKEPTCLPTRIPNLIINGGSGIAVGMATSMPPHNAHEAITASIMMLDNPDMTVDDVLKVMPGPDFPTGGKIMGVTGIRQAYETGRGGITMCAVSEVQEVKGGRSKIVITEIPYAVNKSALISNIASLVNDGTIEGVQDVKDESDREENVRIVIDLKRDGDPNIVLNKLRKHTQFVKQFSVNSVCLDKTGQPTQMGILEQLSCFVDFRKEVVRRRTIYDLDKARDMIHKQIGLYAAITRIDDVVATIKKSADTDSARAALMAMKFSTAGGFGQLLLDADPDIEELTEFFQLSETQANAILALSLRNLTGLEQARIEERTRELSAEIEGYTKILNNKEVFFEVIRHELREMLEHYNTERKTSIEATEMDMLSDEDLIEKEDIILTMTKEGYIKRTGLDQYREQKRGGKGKSGIDTKEGDFVSSVVSCTTHSPLLFFTSRGVAHTKKAWQMPEGAANARGRPLINYVPLNTGAGEVVSSVIAVPDNEAELSDLSMIFVTDFGNIRRTSAEDMLKINKRGKIAMPLEDDNGKPIGKLVNVVVAKEGDTVLIATKMGMAVRVAVSDLRITKSRNSLGVRGVTLAKGDEVISATLLGESMGTSQERQAYLSGGTYTQKSPEGEVTKTELTSEQMEQFKNAEQFFLTVTKNGFGKKVSTHEVKTTNRGGKGLTIAAISDKTGPLLACFPVGEEDGVLLITKAGQTIRVSSQETRVQARATRGVRLFNISDGDEIVYAAKIEA